MELSTRYAGPGDFEVVILMRKALVEEERGEALSGHESLTVISETAIALRDKNILVGLVCDGGIPVGVIWMFSGSLVGPDDGVMRTDLLYIAPKYRRTTALRKLWELAHETGRASGRIKMQGMVLAQNTAVRRMWEKRGATVKAVILEKACHVKSKHGSESERIESGGGFGSGEGVGSAAASESGVRPDAGSGGPDSRPAADVRSPAAGGSVPQPGRSCEPVGQ